MKWASSYTTVIPKLSGLRTSKTPLGLPMAKALPYLTLYSRNLIINTRNMPKHVHLYCKK
jgi:hypothetical protein